MNETLQGGISREGLDAAFDAEEARKSNLLLEAQSLVHQGRAEEATVRLAEAAAIEDRLAAICEDKNLLRKSWVHRFGAICAWAQAGNMYTAIASGERMLAHPDLPERLRLEVSKYVQNLRSVREESREKLARMAVAG